MKVIQHTFMDYLLDSLHQFECLQAKEQHYNTDFPFEIKRERNMSSVRNIIFLICRNFILMLTKKYDSVEIGLKIIRAKV